MQILGSLSSGPSDRINFDQDPTLIPKVGAIMVQSHLIKILKVAQKAIILHTFGVQVQSSKVHNSMV